MLTTGQTRRQGLGLLLAGPFIASGRARAQGKPIRIGAHGDQAKQASYYTLLYKDAIEAFLEDLNGKGGVLGRPIEFIFEDDENNPVVAAGKVEKLAAQGVSYICSIGSSACGVGAQARGEAMKIPIGSPTNTITVLSNPLRHYYFRTSVRDDLIGQALIRFVEQKFKAPRIAVVRDTTETGLLSSDPIIKTFKERNLDVVAVEQITPGSADVTAQALRVKDARPDVVLPFGGSIPDLANYVKAQRAVGNRAQMIGNYTFSIASFGRLAGSASEGFIFADALYPDRPEVKAIEARLIAKRGEKFRNNLSPVHAWEYIRLITDAIGRAGSDDRDAVRDAMEATHDWPIALGPPGMKLNYGPTNHDLFTKPEEIVFRAYHNGEPGPAVPAG